MDRGFGHWHVNGERKKMAERARGTPEAGFRRHQHQLQPTGDLNENQIASLPPSFNQANQYEYALLTLS